MCTSIVLIDPHRHHHHRFELNLRSKSSPGYGVHPISEIPISILIQWNTFTDIYLFYLRSYPTPYPILRFISFCCRILENKFVYRGKKMPINFPTLHTEKEDIRFVNTYLPSLSLSCCSRPRRLFQFV